MLDWVIALVSHEFQERKRVDVRLKFQLFQIFAFF